MTLKSVQFAEDWDRNKVRFPCVGQPKYDGVRGANLFGTMTARTMRPFTNKHVLSFFSQSLYLGLDGELAAEREDHPRLCSLTTSATNTIEGAPWLMWHVFDYLRPETVDLPYIQRYKLLHRHIEGVKWADPKLGAHLQIMPMVILNNMDELEEYVDQNCIKGYEGTILRDLNGKHKNGRSSPAHGGLLRIKPFIEVDALITGIIEGRRNENELEQNHLGYAKRSTHAENMVPNGMVGALEAVLLEDAVHPITKAVIHKKGDPVQFGAGRLTHDERRRYFENPSLILQKRMKGQIFPHGIKDKPRFPTFQSLRADSDYVPK